MQVGFGVYIWLGSGRVNGAAGRVHAYYQNMGVPEVLYAGRTKILMQKHGSPLRFYGEFIVSDKSLKYTASIPGYEVLQVWVRFDRFAFVFLSNPQSVWTC